MMQFADNFTNTFGQLASKMAGENAEKGVGRACLRLMRDSVMEQPRVPIDKSTLRGSGSMFVQGDLKGTSESMASAGGKPTPATQSLDKGNSDVVVGEVGFNTPYAAHLHEHPEYEFTEPGSGGKYVEAKLAANQERYMRIIAKSIGAGGSVQSGGLE